jgi:hypothetical protein
MTHLAPPRSRLARGRGPAVVRQRVPASAMRRFESSRLSQPVRSPPSFTGGPPKSRRIAAALNARGVRTPRGGRMVCQVREQRVGAGVDDPARTSGGEAQQVGDVERVESFSHGRRLPCNCSTASTPSGVKNTCASRSFSGCSCHAKSPGVLRWRARSASSLIQCDMTVLETPALLHTSLCPGLHQPRSAAARLRKSSPTPWPQRPQTRPGSACSALAVRSAPRVHAHVRAGVGPEMSLLSISTSSREPPAGVFKKPGNVPVVEFDPGVSSSGRWRRLISTKTPSPPPSGRGLRSNKAERYLAFARSFTVSFGCSSMQTWLDARSCVSQRGSDLNRS